MRRKIEILGEMLRWVASGDDPTPNKESRHLILLENSVVRRPAHSDSAKHLAATDFDKITLNWVDFD